MDARRNSGLVALAVLAFAGCAAVMAAQIAEEDVPAEPAPMPVVYQAAAGNPIVPSFSAADVFNVR